MNVKILIGSLVVTFLSLIFVTREYFDLKRYYKNQIYNIRTTYEYEINRMSKHECGKTSNCISSKIPIKPIIQISIDPDGKTDTTFIYKLK